MVSENSRLKWVDIAKGIGIISVVLGHSRNHFLSHYIYWFHMPLFFVLSGYLHKQPDTYDMLLESTRRKAVRFFVPYVSFYFLVLVVVKLESNRTLSLTVKDLTPLIYGGQYLGGALAPFWFVTVLFLTQVTFSILLLTFKDAKGVFAFVFSAYVLSYFDSLMSVSGHDIKFFWNADVVLLAVVFFGSGYLLKKNKIHLDGKVLVPCTLIVCSAIVLDAVGIVNYSLNMRTSRYNHFLLDLLIPIGFCILIIYLSLYLEKFSSSKYLAQIGTYSLPIMYLHLSINIVSDHFFPRNFLFVTVAGVIIPILISKYVFEKNALTRILFLGESPKKTTMRGIRLHY